MKELTVIIPAYNELRNFQAGKLQQIDDYFKARNLNWEVIVVDDGSSDGSGQQIRSWLQDKKNWRFISNPHQGKAGTVMTGVLAAKKPYLLITDFDQATPISELEKLRAFLDKGYSIVIGSREAKGSLRQDEPWYRHLMGKVFNFFVQLITIRGIHDTQCGFKLFETKIARRLFQALKVYRPRAEKYPFTGAFDVELLFLAQKLNLKIAEVPINWYHTSTTRVNPVRDSIRMFFDVLKIRWADITGQYRA